MIKEYKFNQIVSKHYLNPGENLSEIELISLYKSLIRINEESKNPVDNKYLKSGFTYEELKLVYKSCIITSLHEENDPFGFLISPIIESKEGVILHAGLIIFNKNPGGDFISLTALCNFTMAYKKYGRLLTTNISSTPSIIEVFSKTVNNPWPSPKMNTKFSPKGYRYAVNALKEKYMDVYFPNNSNVIINDKRFTMTSNSKEMGFSTNYYELSRANEYIFQSFCKTWIDYEKSEDIIQVGEIKFTTYIYQIVLLSYLKFKMYKIGLKKKQQSSMEKIKHAA